MVTMMLVVAVFDGDAADDEDYADDDDAADDVGC